LGVEADVGTLIIFDLHMIGGWHGRCWALSVIQKRFEITNHWQKQNMGLDAVCERGDFDY